jgi:hypothetical protein
MWPPPENKKLQFNSAILLQAVDGKRFSPCVLDAPQCAPGRKHFTCDAGAGIHLTLSKSVSDMGSAKEMFKRSAMQERRFF